MMLFADANAVEGPSCSLGSSGGFSPWLRVPMVLPVGHLDPPCIMTWHVCEIVVPSSVLPLLSSPPLIFLHACPPPPAPRADFPHFCYSLVINYRDASVGGGGGESERRLGCTTPQLGTGFRLFCFGRELSAGLWLF